MTKKPAQNTKTRVLRRFSRRN